MARARNVKPGFFENEVLAEVDPLGRLLFVGLWMLADRAGRLEDRPKRIKNEILGYDDCDVDALLSALAERGFIHRYSVGSNRYIEVTNFLKHQNPHLKEKKSVLPAPDEHHASTVRAPDEHHASTVLAPDQHHASTVRAPEISERAGLIPDSPIPDSPIPDSPIPDSPIPDSPIPGSPIPGSPIPDPRIQSPAPGDSLRSSPSRAPITTTAEAVVVTGEVARGKRKAEPAKTAATWKAYGTAYLARYGVDPVSNAKANAQLSQLVERLSVDEAPAVAEFYVRSQNARYVACGHSIGVLLVDAEKLRTEWARGRSVTQTEARMGDRTAARGNVFGTLIAEVKNGTTNG